jgi:hypothetical protein
MTFGFNIINKGALVKQLRHVLWFFIWAKIKIIIEKETL